MNPRDFVVRLRESIVSENVALYRNLFANAEKANVTDPYWMRALDFYSELDEEQRTVLLDIIRQVIVDTLSNVLGIIDGVNSMAGGPREIELRLTPNGQRANGMLQELFLELEEQNRR